MNSGDVVGAVTALTNALENAHIEYAISGAIALAYWTAPRATLDIDVALNVQALELPKLLEVLTAAGCELNKDALTRAQLGDFGARFAGIRIDLFLPVLPISLDAMNRRVRVPFAEQEIWILSAEDILSFKLIFGRTKDFADIERLIAAQRGRLDSEYLDRQIRRLFEPTDPRFRRYEELSMLARQ